MKRIFIQFKFQKLKKNGETCRPQEIGEEADKADPSAGRREITCGSWSAGRGGVGWRASAVADLRNFLKTTISKIVISLSISRRKPPCSSFRDYENSKILLLKSAAKSGLFGSRADSEFWILRIQGFRNRPNAWQHPLVVQTENPEASLVSNEPKRNRRAHATP
jgi:hypothetical protein